MLTSCWHHYQLKVTPVTWHGKIGSYDCRYKAPGHPHSKGSKGCNIKPFVGKDCGRNLPRQASAGPLTLRFTRQLITRRNKNGVASQVKDVCSFELSLDVHMCRGRSDNCKLNSSWSTSRVDTADYQGKNVRINVPGHGCRRWFMGVAAVTNGVLTSYLQLDDARYMKGCPDMKDGMVKPSCQKK